MRNAKNLRAAASAIYNCMWHTLTIGLTKPKFSAHHTFNSAGECACVFKYCIECLAYIRTARSTYKQTAVATDKADITIVQFSHAILHICTLQAKMLKRQI